MRRVLLALAAVAASLHGTGRAEAGRDGGKLGQAYRAFSEGEYGRALALARSIDRKKVENGDYVAYIAAQSAYLTGDYSRALRELEALQKDRGSRFRDWAAWRAADCLWQLGRHEDARKAYARLVGRRGSPDGDAALARFRMAEADARAGKTSAAVRALQELRMDHPGHMLDAVAAERLRQLGGAQAAALSPRQRIARAAHLRDAKKWDMAIAELRHVSDDEPEAVLRERDFQIAMTLFKMRRQYQRASDILLRLYKEMGDRAAEALFHGARALSRVDRDADAIVWYQRVVAEYPRSRWAAEAQFLSGWLEFNMGNYERALPHLEETRRRFGSSRYAEEARWYIGFSYYLLGRHGEALPHFETLSRKKDRLEAGQGHYWKARALDQLGREAEATREYRALVGRFPLSWYALLARARLAERGQSIDPFGDSPRDPGEATRVSSAVNEALARDPLIRKVDELIAAGLGVEAGEELRRGERAFIRRHPRHDSLAMALDRYRKAGNYNRPWMLSIVWGGARAHDAPPKGPARVWWEHALPLAYRELVEKWRHLGDAPPYYFYSIMRKESGFDPHVHSYANAIGLVQMIPRTTRRVVQALGLTYTDDLLFDPELNIRTGSWYIGKLLRKFRGQIPLGAGSFNSGPRPVMRWIDKNGHRPIDEMVELVSYSQTRGYMKKVTEIYARYLYLYEGTIYEQPLTVNRDYLKDELTY